jgi:propanol-preferring alcohol dehydrogenase
MKIVHILGNENVEVIDVTDPKPTDTKVVVKIESSMICGTEMHQYKGSKTMAGNGGHEAAGVVVATDQSTKVKEGDRVSLFLPFTHCFRCPACLTGEWLHCWNPTPRDPNRLGTHSQYILAQDYLCLPIPDDMTFDVAAVVGDCFGTSFRVMKKMGLNAGDVVLVTGCGPIGLAAVKLAKFYGATVITTDMNDYRLAEVAKMGVADHVLDSKKDDVVEKVKELTDGRGVSIAIECSGSKAAQQECLDAAGVFAKVACIGLGNNELTINMNKHFIQKELTVYGSWASAPEDHFDLIALIKRGLSSDGLVSHRYPIDEGPAAFKQFGDGGAMKIAIHPWGDSQPM